MFCIESLTRYENIEPYVILLRFLVMKCIELTSFIYDETLSAPTELSSALPTHEMDSALEMIVRVQTKRSVQSYHCISHTPKQACLA